MGNNKKTVKCSFCNRLGHNRVSCEKLKTEVETNRTQYGSSHPDVREYDEYLQDYSDKSRSNANRKRHCSYCIQAGHNIRTCHVKEKDFTKIQNLPAMPHFKQWRMVSKRTVANASHDPPRATGWISKVEVVTSWQSLCDSEGLVNLDCKLAQAVMEKA